MPIRLLTFGAAHGAVRPQLQSGRPHAHISAPHGGVFSNHWLIFGFRGNPLACCCTPIRRSGSKDRSDSGGLPWRYESAPLRLRCSAFNRFSLTTRYTSRGRSRWHLAGGTELDSFGFRPDEHPGTTSFRPGVAGLAPKLQVNSRRV